MPVNFDGHLGPVEGTFERSRERLPDRRHHWLYRFECGGQHYTGGIGRFDDGRISEVFINGTKAGSTAEANAQDAAIIASLALQQGCPLETIRHALARPSGTGGPAGDAPE